MTEEAEDINREAACRGYLDPWPPVRGEYLLGDPGARVAVVTLASTFHPRGAAISGPCRTENLGLEKIVANVISNSNIRVLIICGAESKGHLPGNTLIALHKNGIDERGRIIGSKGAIPFIQNLPAQAIERFARQVELVERIGLEDREEIERLISGLTGRELLSKGSFLKKAVYAGTKVSMIRPRTLYDLLANLMRG